MKNAIFSSTVFATLAAFVAADQTCWMTLGQYTTGGNYCVAPLPAFSDQAGCNTAASQCQASYSDCKTQTQSTSACLVLMSRCQILSSFCSSYCAPNSNGQTSSTCSLDNANSWNGRDTLTTPEAPVPVNQAAATPIATTPKVYQQAGSTATPLIAPDVPCGQCFTDGSNKKRGFESGPHYAPYGTKLTIGLCMATCQGAGYKYAGLEYGSECWCGNSFLNGAAPSSECSMTCAGDSTQTCGGSWLMNVYQKGCAAPTVPKPSTAAAYVAPKVSSTPIAAYNYKTPVASTPVANYNNKAPVASTPVAAYNAPSKTSAVAKNTPTVGICNIPSAYATPIGGYHAPLVACNDDSSYTSSPWKLYTSHVTSTCPTYSSSNYKQACTDACTTQYNNCVKHYAGSYSTYSSTSAYKVRRGAPAMEKRTWWPFSYGSTSSSTYGSTNTAYTNTKDTYSSASDKCSSQLASCKSANSALTVAGSCSSGGVYHAPSTQSGSSTYNSGSNSYGSYNSGNSYAQSSSNTYTGSSTDNNDYWKQ